MSQSRRPELPPSKPARMKRLSRNIVRRPKLARRLLIYDALWSACDCPNCRAIEGETRCVTAALSLYQSPHDLRSPAPKNNRPPGCRMLKARQTHPVAQASSLSDFTAGRMPILRSRSDTAFQPVRCINRRPQRSQRRESRPEWPVGLSTKDPKVHVVLLCLRPLISPLGDLRDLQWKSSLRFETDSAPYPHSGTC